MARPSVLRREGCNLPSSTWACQFSLFLFSDPFPDDSQNYFLRFQGLDRLTISGTGVIASIIIS